MPFTKSPHFKYFVIHEISCPIIPLPLVYALYCLFLAINNKDMPSNLSEHIYGPLKSFFHFSNAFVSALILSILGKITGNVILYLLTTWEPIFFNSLELG